MSSIIINKIENRTTLLEILAVRRYQKMSEIKTLYCLI